MVVVFSINKMYSVDSVVVQNISTFAALCDFFSISVILLGADIVCLEFFFF